MQGRPDSIYSLPGNFCQDSLLTHTLLIMVIVNETTIHTTCMTT